MREDWIRQVRDEADAELAAALRIDGRPLSDDELAALRVLLGRLSWASLHWGTEHVDLAAWIHLSAAFVRAGWTPPRGTPGPALEPRVECSCAIPDAPTDADLRRAGIDPTTDTRDRLCFKCKRPVGPPRAARVIPSRSSDPATSRAAEPAPLKAGTQRHRLLAAFGQPAAADGLTDEEAADLADGVPYRSEFAKRCSELRAAELLEVVDGVTRPGVAGHQRIVSRITDRGRDALRLLTPTGLPKPDDGA